MISYTETRLQVAYNTGGNSAIPRQWQQFREGGLHALQHCARIMLGQECCMYLGTGDICTRVVCIYGAPCMHTLICTKAHQHVYNFKQYFCKSLGTCKQQTAIANVSGETRTGQSRSSVHPPGSCATLALIACSICTARSAFCSPRRPCQCLAAVKACKQRNTDVAALLSHALHSPVDRCWLYATFSAFVGHGMCLFHRRALRCCVSGFAMCHA